MHSALLRRYALARCRVVATLPTLASLRLCSSPASESRSDPKENTENREQQQDRPGTLPPMRRSSATSSQQDSAQTSAARIFVRLSESLDRLDVVDRRIAQSSAALTQQIGFNETLAAGVSDSLQTYIVAAALDPQEPAANAAPRKQATGKDSSSSDAAAEAASAAAAARRQRDVKLDRLALERALSKLQFEFNSNRQRTAAPMERRPPTSKPEVAPEIFSL